MITDAQLSTRISKSALSWKSFLLRGRVLLEFALACIVVTLLGLLYLNQSSQASNLVYEIQDLNARRRLLRREIAELRYEIAVAESLSRVAEKAMRLGLAETSQVQRLAVSYPESDRPEKDLQTRQRSFPVTAYLSADALGAWERMVRQFIEWIKGPRAGP